MTQTATTKKQTNSRTAAREERRQQLINATIDSISKRGFSGTTLETVTKGAKLSHGIVNFHFKNKEALYVETLGFLAQEHYEHWHSAMKKAGPGADEQIAAIIDVDFDRRICSPKKLAVWFAFWGQARHRPTYLQVHSKYDEQRFVELTRLCREIALDGGYQHIDPDAAARSIEALIDGFWLSILMYPKTTQREVARNDCFAFLADLFPSHFQHMARTSAPASSNAVPAQ